MEPSHSTTKEELDKTKVRLTRAEELLKRMIRGTVSATNCQCCACEVRKFLDEVI